MARSKRTPKEIALQEKAKELVKGLNIHDMDDIQSLSKDMVATILEGELEADSPNVGIIILSSTNNKLTSFSYF